MSTAYPQATRTNSMAVGALVSGIVAWIAAPFVAGVVAVVLGHIARGQIRRNGEEGDGMAVGGLVLGYTNILFSMIVIGGFIAILAGALWLTDSSVTETPVPVPSVTAEPLPTN
jgi:hypothetical protein